MADLAPYPDTMTKTMPMLLGVQLDMVGEDGDVIALGHVDDRRAAAALHALYRHHGIHWDDQFTYAEVRGGFRQTWARLDDEADGRDDYEWIVQWDREPTEADVFPVTLWSA